LEADLHREFADFGVNAVNRRRDFFRVDLGQIRDAVQRISGMEAEFRMTALAEEFYETLRLLGVVEEAA
jgi:hypothetical protein